MTLEEYEKLREEKRAGLNKKASSDVKADPKAFEGMKAYTRSTGEEEKNGLELSNKKQIGQRKSGLVEKTRKEVTARFMILIQQCEDDMLPSPHSKDMENLLILLSTNYCMKWMQCPHPASKAPNLFLQAGS